jgi:hypothetical protein
VKKLALTRKTKWRKSCYFLPAAFLRAAHLAFIASDSFFLPAAVRPFFFEGAVELLPPAFLLAAQRAFIASESFLRPAAVRPRFFRPGAFAGELLVVPFRLAQRARAAAANFARVAADMGRRLRRERRPALRVRPELVEPPKRVDNRCSSAPICCLMESACDSF